MKKKTSLIAALCAALAIALLPGCTFTRYAAKGDIQGIQKLIQEGKDINQHDSYGWTPLMWAVYYGYYDTVKFMLENRADPNARTVEDYGAIARDSTPLMIASYYGYNSVVRLLLKNGADKNARNGQGDTAHSIAEKFDFVEILDILEKGADYRASRSGEDGGKTRKKFTEADAFAYLIIMNDGKRIVGDLVSQTRTTFTVRTKYGTVTVEKDRVLQVIMK